MATAAQVRHWQTLMFRDAEPMMTWLGTIGFREHATYRDATDPLVVVHAEWVRPDGGAVMFGSAREGAVGASAPGNAACYLVVDDVDAVVDAAVAGGASIVDPVSEKDYGGRGATVCDPEGNLWSFGTYQPR